MKWASWAESHLQGGHYENERNYVALCAFHQDGNPSMAVEVELGVFVCRSCGARGRIESLARQLQVPAVPSVTTEHLLRQLSKGREDPHVETVQPMAESWLAQFDHWHPYWCSRLPEAVVKQFRLGYDPATDSATIPWRNEHGAPIGVVRRRLSRNARPKYLEPHGLPKAELLWGQWELPNPLDRVVVCEGPIDAMACWAVGVPAVALSGSWMSAEQGRWLRRFAPRQILLGLDNDAAGRGQPSIPGDKGSRRPATGTWRAREVLQGAALEIKVVVWSGKDPAEVSDDIRLRDIEWALSWPEWKQHTRTP